MHLSHILAATSALAVGVHGDRNHHIKFPLGPGPVMVSSRMIAMEPTRTFARRHQRELFPALTLPTAVIVQILEDAAADAAAAAPLRAVAAPA